jgi:hypothetical protein
VVAAEVLHFMTLSGAELGRGAPGTDGSGRLVLVLPLPLAYGLEGLAVGGIGGVSLVKTLPVEKARTSLLCDRGALIFYPKADDVWAHTV